MRTLASGKPVVEGVDGHVSLSHTDGLVACAVADVPVGVDVERAAQRRDVLAIARDWMHESERRTLAALPDELRVRRFLLHFTLREAFVKATGVGLGGEPDSIRFAVADSGSGWLARLQGDRERSAQWRCHVSQPFPGYIAALVWSSRSSRGIGEHHEVAMRESRLGGRDRTSAERVNREWPVTLLLGERAGLTPVEGARLMVPRAEVERCHSAAAPRTP